MRRALLLAALALVAAPAPAADWSAKPDPAPKDQVVIPPDPVADVPVPMWGFAGAAVFADRHGPFAALVGRAGGDESVRVYDLRTGKPAHQPHGEFRLNDPLALSPDGAMLAGASHGVRGSAVAVIDLKTGKVVHELAAGRGPPGWVGFVGPDRVAATVNDADGGVAVFDLKTGKEVRRLAVGRWGPPAVSPGGEYLAVGTDDAGAKLYRLSTGESAGVVRAAGREPGDSCRGLAFSPDGRQLAGVIGFTKQRIVVWSVADGSTVRTVPVPAGLHPGLRDGLSWAADGSAWLTGGGAVLDPQTGKPLWHLPAARAGNRPARVLASDHAAVAYLAEGDDPHKYRLKVVGKPKDQVAAVRDALRAGGSPTDAVLPPVKPVDLAAVPPVEVPLPGIEWAGKPDPNPPPKKIARQPVPLLFRGAAVQAGYVGRGDRPAAVFELADQATRRAEVDGSASVGRRVQRVDLYTGRATGGFALPDGLRVIGTGPDTDLVLTTDADGLRVDAWAVGGGKHVAGWRPYAAEVDAAARPVAFAAALGTDKVLTVSAAGKVVLWALPDVKPVYLADVPGLTHATLTPGGTYLIGWQRTAFRVLETATGEPAGDLIPPFPARPGSGEPRAVAVRADGAEAAAVVGPVKGRLTLVRWDLATGKPLDPVPFGDAPPAPPPPPTNRPGFPPDRFGGPGYPPGFVMPAPGEPFAAPMFGPEGVLSSPSRLGYAGPDHLLADDRILFSIPHKAAVWHYHLSPSGEGRVLGTQPDGRVWWVAATEHGKDAALVSGVLPEPAAAARIKVAAGSDGLVKPGAVVALKLDLTGSGADAVRDRVRDELTRQWAAWGLTVAAAKPEPKGDGKTDPKDDPSLQGKAGPKADLTVTLTVAEKATDRVVDVPPGFPLRPDPANPGRKAIKAIELEASVAVTGADGKVVWKSPATPLRMAGSPFDFAAPPAAPEEVEKQLHRRTWEQVPGWAARSALPRFLGVGPDGKAATLPGRSGLSAVGVIPADE